MIIVDWIIIGVIAISSIIGLFRGLVKEALSLLVWVAAFIISIKFRLPMAEFLESYIDTPSVRHIAASSILFFGTLLSGSLLSFLICSLVKASGISGTDRLLGSIFGFLRGALIVIAAIVYLPKWTHVAEDQWWQQSWLIEYFSTFEDIFHSLLDSTINVYKEQVFPSQSEQQ